MISIALFLRFVLVLLLYGQPVNCVSDATLVQGTNVNLGEALMFLREYDKEASGMCFRVSSTQWTYSTNMTDFNKRKMVEEQTLKAKFDKISWRNAVRFDWTRLPDPIVRRQLKLLLTNSRASLTDDKYNEIYHLISEMKDVFAHVRICPYNTQDSFFCDLELENEIKKILATSRNPYELAHVWQEWHDRVGPPLKNKFMRYLDLANQASRMNGFLDAGEEMRYVYEEEDFENEIAHAVQKLMPLYKELFTYVRRKLVLKYGPENVRPDGPLPAHLLGNMWGQDWSNLEDIVMPYSEVKRLEVTDEMLRQGFTPLRMFQMAEEFFISLGMKAMPPEFWRFSMLERPNGRKVQCTASAWDFCNKVDFRIKQCTEVNMEHLINIHHEMAHIQYYLYYSDQPYIYRDGANPGFHEGVSSAITLSVFNPVHLHRVGLFNNNTNAYENNINFLMYMALKKVAYAPFAYLVDQWRYQIFQYGVKRMNTEWWELKLRFQGVVPPVPRSEQHLDAASKRHIPADIPYMKYFVALLLEFQIHKALCSASGHEGPLHSCDIYRSREAGRVLGDALKAGKAKHWKEILRTLTREEGRLSAEAMLEYFQPLLLWLKSQNRNEGIIGWTTTKEDTLLFQPLIYNSQPNKKYSLIVILSVFMCIIVYI